MSGGIGRASVLLASGTMVSRILGFVKAIVLAQTIGVVGSVSADAFTNATMLPSNIYSLIAGGVLSAVLVPQVVRAARHEDGGQRYVNRLVTLSIAVLGGVTLLATVAVPLIAALYGASLSGEQLALVIAFAYWCMPQVFFYGLYAVLGEVLNARGLFGPFAWAPVLNNIVGVLGLWLFSAVFGADPSGGRVIGDWTPSMIALLGGTTTAGVALQALVLLLFWRRVGLRFRLDFRWRGTGLGKAGKLAGWTFGMLLVMQFSGLVETIVLNLAFGHAGVAASQNAYLIFVLPHSIVTVSIATAYFTRMSAAASESRFGDLVRDFSGGARLIGLFIVFAAFALAVISPAFARIFESSPQGVTDLAIILCCYLVGLVSFCGLFLVQRAFYALEDTRTQFWLFLATMPLHVFGMAIASTLPVTIIAAALALAQSVMSLLRLGILTWLLRRRIGRLDLRRILGSYLRFAAAAIAAAAVGALLMQALGAYQPGGFARQGIGPAFLSCLLGGVVMVLVYLPLLLLTRSPELREALAPVLRRLRGGGGPGTAGGGHGSTASQDGREASQAEPEAGQHEREARHEAPDAEQGAPRAVPQAGGDERIAPVTADDWRRGRVPWQDEVTRGVERREEEAYAGAFAAMNATGDLSTAGILLPMHATPGSGPRTRRERRELEQQAAAALAARRRSEAAPDSGADSPRGATPTVPAVPGPPPLQTAAASAPSPTPREPLPPSAVEDAPAGPDAPTAPSKQQPFHRPAGLDGSTGPDDVALDEAAPDRAAQALFAEWFGGDESEPTGRER